MTAVGAAAASSAEITPGAGAKASSGSWFFCPAAAILSANLLSHLENRLF